ncbi:MAG TPA: response regulator [Bacteroidia bacterium]|nr:response regulator [Bacteroidia bacterium]
MESSLQSDATAVLLLDDEFDIITVFKQGLEKQGIKVFAFTDPLLALEHFRINSEQYGLVISDLRMPNMNGYEFIKKVKEMKPQIKVLFMTAFEIDDIEFRRLLPSVKMDGFIQKPISLKDLTSAISKHIKVNVKVY